jgi:hypothetical protein
METESKTYNYDTLRICERVDGLLDGCLSDLSFKFVVALGRGSYSSKENVG